MKALFSIITTALLVIILIRVEHIADRIPEIRFDSIIVDPPLEIKTTIPIIRSDWDLFIEALIYVESKGDERAVGKNDDGGVLQIRPIAVKEANRIMGFDKFADSDRFDRLKSIEIWETIQEYHNPGKSFERALKLHNPNGGEEYSDKVMNKYKQLKHDNY